MAAHRRFICIQNAKLRIVEIQVIVVMIQVRPVEIQVNVVKLHLNSLEVHAGLLENQVEFNLYFDKKQLVVLRY